MSAPMHTPGPWVVNPFKAWVDSTTDFCEDGMPVPICALAWPTNYRSEAVTYANADLIAAAPDLLATLIALEKWFDTDQEILDALPEAERADNARQLAKIRAAISCALGFGEGGPA